jgi:putative CocE/NonD family hydrolase
VGALGAVAPLVAWRGSTLTASAQAAEPQVSRDLRVRMDDGVELLARLGGRGPLVGGELPRRPVIIEFSPYGPGCCVEYGGPAYNYLQVHIRGTGASPGSFDALGPRTQRDVVELLSWACSQPWSNGRLGLYGFSASAITVYNSLHDELPCVQTAVLGSGTYELYRDLLYPGGVPNGVPALGVLGLIAAPLAQNLPQRLAEQPGSVPDAAGGMARQPVDYQSHPTLDSYWQERGFRGDVNHLPPLMTDGFFDVESRGAFQAFQRFRGDGAHLLVIGAHDGVTANAGGPGRQTVAWYDRYLKDVRNGIEREPAVQLWMAKGDRVNLLNGKFVTTSGQDWPLPGTRWLDLHLDAAKSGTATSINDGTLTGAPGGPATQSYPAVFTLPSATDQPNAAIVAFNGPAPLVDMRTAEPLGLSYTTAPFPRPVQSAGPASLEVTLSSTAPETDIWAVLSDVWPDGTAHPVATGRLRNSFPDIDKSKSLLDAGGDVVQPYGRYDARKPAAPGEARRYFVEFWPIGNQFDAGHRLRLHILGASGASNPTTPGVNTIRIGQGASVLRFPVLPGTDPASVLGAHAVSSSPQPPGRDSAQPNPRAGSLPATGAESAAGWGLMLVSSAAVSRRVYKSMR